MRWITQSKSIYKICFVNVDIISEGLCVNQEPQKFSNTCRLTAKSLDVIVQDLT